MSVVTSKLIVQLLDKVSGPSRAIGKSIGRLTEMQRVNAARLSAVQGHLLGAAGAGYALYRGLSAPVKAATDFQKQMDGIRQKADLTTEQLKKVGETARRVGAATGQGATEIGKAIDFMTGMGSSASQATAAALPIGKAATAYAAAVEDLAAASFAVIDNLKVPAQQTAKALDVMAQAGKAGGFELKDMAHEFPTVTAQAQALGIKGVKGVADLTAALEVARKGAASGAEAANNMQNFMKAIVSKTTLANFKKFGVDVPRELEKAAKAGASPIEHMMAVIDKITKGGRPELLAKLFSDMQAQNFIRPMLANMELYRDIRKQALDASGIVEADFQKRIQTYAGTMARFNAQLLNMKITIGNALLPVLSRLMKAIEPFITTVTSLAQRFPKATGVIISLASGLVGLRIAALAAQFGFFWMAGSVLAAAKAGLKGVAGAARLASAGIKSLRGAVLGASMLGAIGEGGMMAGIVGSVGPAVSAIMGAVGTIAAGIAGITAPIWGTIAAVVAAVLGLALAVYNYWVPISNFVSGFVSVIWDALKELAATIAGFGGEIATAVGSWAKEKLIDFGAWLGIDPATMNAAIDFAVKSVTDVGKRIVDVVLSIPSQVGGWIADIFTMNTYSDAATAGFRNAGERAGHALVDAVKNAFSGLFEWFRDLPGRIISAIGKIDLGSIIKMPSLPSWLGGGQSPAVAKARAAGGPVRAGLPYLVGERGPEIVSFARNAFVNSAAASTRMMRNAALASAVAMPAAAAPAAGSPTTINVTINATTNASAREIAREVKQALSSELNALSHGSYSDGAN